MKVFESDSTEEFGTEVIDAWLRNLQQQNWEPAQLRQAATILGLWSHSGWTACPEDDGGAILQNFLAWSESEQISFEWMDNVSRRP